MKSFLKYVLALAMVGAGLNHFLNPTFYVRMMPDYLPWHEALVALSGVAEALLGVLLLVPRCTRLAAWGLIALFIAVFPANVNMALHPEQYPTMSSTALWLRLPLQALLVLWAWWYTRGDVAVLPAADSAPSRS